MAGRSRVKKDVKAVGSGIARRRIERRNAGFRSDGRPRKSDQRWDAILSGAARVFRRVGYAQATLEDVASEVGINRATLYYYVGTKSELLVAILDEPIHRMTADIKDIQALDVPPREKLAKAVEQHMHALADNYPELFVFLAENLHLITVGTDRDIQKNAREYGRIMTEIIQEGIDAGEFRKDFDPRLVMLGVIGMCNWSHRWYQAGGEYTLPEIGEQFAQLVEHGLVNYQRSPKRSR